MGEGLLSSDSGGEDRFDSIEILILGSGDDYVLFSDAGCTVNGGDGADRFDFSDYGAALANLDKRAEGAS